MPKSMPFVAVLVVCGIFSQIAEAATPQTFFSDLNGTATPGGYIVGQYAPGNTFVIGAAFTPSGQTYTLTEIQALLSFSSGVNNMIIGLYQDSGGAPGQLLESWTLNNVLGASPSIIALSSVLQPTLRAGQRYWITAGMSSPTSTGVWWINNTGGACCGSPDEVQGIATGSLNGEPFTPGAPTTAGFHAFAVSGVPQATPIVYVVNRGADNISAYTINTTTGGLTPLLGSPFSSTLGTPNALAVHPTGKFLYVAPFGGASVEAFSIDPGGALTPVPGSPFATDSGAVSVATDPTGRFAYVANIFANDISGFTINPSTGALTPITGSPFPCGSWPHGVTVDPLGRFAYVASCGYGQGCFGVGPGSVSEYIIDPVTGALRAVSGSPVGAGQNPFFLAVDPTGRFVYAPNPGSGNVSAFTIMPGLGSLTQISVSPFPAGGQPAGVALDLTGRFVYVANAGSASVSGYTINSATGALTPIGTFASGTYASSPAVDGSGQFLYVPDSISNDVLGYAINPASGVLTEVGVFPTGAGPVAVATTAPALPAGPACSYSLNPSGQGFSTQGGLGSFSVNTGPTCGWTATASASWITVFARAIPHVCAPQCGGGGGFQGTGAVSYSVASNVGGPRTGSITVGGQTYSITQAGFTCSYTIGPTFASPNDIGGNISVSVGAPGGCPWTAVSNVPWITVHSGAAGSGGGVVVLSVAPNTGGLRSGTATIAGQTFTVNQGAGACGALDVTSEVSTSGSSGLTWIPLYDYSQQIRVSSSTDIFGPVYLVLLGEPTHYGFPNDSGLIGGGSLTHCFSSSGDYLLLVSGTDLVPGRPVSIPVVWFTQNISGFIRYTVKVLSGRPSK